MYSFSATIFKEGMNYLVEVPLPVVKKFNRKGNIPVRGFVDKAAFRGTCVARKNNRLVLFLNSEIRKKINRTENDMVSIDMEFDPESRDILVPEDLELILSEEEGLFEKFLSLTQAHRRELTIFVLGAKKPETRLKYIRRVADHIRKYRKY